VNQTDVDAVDPGDEGVVEQGWGAPDTGGDEQLVAQGYRQMDAWSDEQVATFKARALTEQDLLLLADEAPPTLVAEGDSWFDYRPGTDVIDCLRAFHGYRILNEAAAGDTLENMIYGTQITRQFQPVSPSIAIVLERLEQHTPKALLFSGGGNDIAGDEFASFLNHGGSGLPVLRMDYVETMIEVVFRRYFEDLIAKVAEVSPTTSIVVHGYGHTRPTGIGVGWWVFRFAGPWLRPALASKRILDAAEQLQAVATMIDRYNAMLASLAADHQRFVHVDLREELDPDTDWANELHLSNSAFRRVADRIHEAVAAL
jgi:hypothetical protein